ncbi:hypothetical protein HELRODRAFT_172594 [Helobdella robusta]|uniref:Uncharacterized protein n=1 Tax=Helobdella robusta TaxID=6412 RepID=T1F5K8_HELRO|nr:hypothetical protein HELRODRAFT_172594 [Helobdella robusta]ESO04238.1 hypothetical protein HELRODRAFT_172594 [Helobdella robusta]
MDTAHVPTKRFIKHKLDNPLNPQVSCYFVDEIPSTVNIPSCGSIKYCASNSTKNIQKFKNKFCFTDSTLGENLVNTTAAKSDVCSPNHDIYFSKTKSFKNHKSTNIQEVPLSNVNSNSLLESNSNLPVCVVSANARADIEYFNLSLGKNMAYSTYKLGCMPTSDRYLNPDNHYYSSQQLEPFQSSFSEKNYFSNFSFEHPALQKPSMYNSGHLVRDMKKKKLLNQPVRTDSINIPHPLVRPESRCQQLSACPSVKNSSSRCNVCANRFSKVFAPTPSPLGFSPAEKPLGKRLPNSVNLCRCCTSDGQNDDFIRNVHSGDQYSYKNQCPSYKLDSARWSQIRHSLLGPRHQQPSNTCNPPCSNPMPSCGCPTSNYQPRVGFTQKEYYLGDEDNTKVNITVRVEKDNQSYPININYPDNSRQCDFINESDQNAIYQDPMFCNEDQNDGLTETAYPQNDQYLFGKKVRCGAQAGLTSGFFEPLFNFFKPCKPNIDDNSSDENVGRKDRKSNRKLTSENEKDQKRKPPGKDKEKEKAATKTDEPPSKTEETEKTPTQATPGKTSLISKLEEVSLFNGSLMSKYLFLLLETVFKRMSPAGR